MNELRRCALAPDFKPQKWKTRYLKWALILRKEIGNLCVSDHLHPAQRSALFLVVMHLQSCCWLLQRTGRSIRTAPNSTHNMALSLPVWFPLRVDQPLPLSVAKLEKDRNVILSFVEAPTSSGMTMFWSFFLLLLVCSGPL